MIVLEKTIEKYLKKKVKESGGLSFKFSSPSHRGVPDQIIILNKNIYFIEVKSQMGMLSRLQDSCIKELRSHGCRVEIVYSKDDVDEFLRYN